MSKRFQVQLLNGQLRNTIPNGTAGVGGKTPYILNLFVGDSNAAGLSALWSNDLVDQLPASARTEIDGAANYRVAGAFLGNNWTRAAVEQGFTTSERNKLISGGGFVGLTNDLGNDTDAGTGGPASSLTIDPLWSLGACNQQFYRNNLSAAGAADFTDNSSLSGGVFYIKHAASGAQVGRRVRERNYAPVAPDNKEFRDTDTTVSFHPDADAATPSLYTNLQANALEFRRLVTDPAAALQGQRAYFDTLYINFFSASGKHLGGSQMYSDFLAFYQRLATNIGLPAGAVPNMVICKPQIGAFEPERVTAHREAFGRITAKFPHVAFVDLNDLSMNGKNHFTAESYVEMGRRMAVARQSLPTSTLYEISI